MVDSISASSSGDRRGFDALNFVVAVAFILNLEFFFSRFAFFLLAILFSCFELFDCRIDVLPYAD